MGGARNGAVPFAAVIAATIALIATAIVWTEKKDIRKAACAAGQDP